jgi:putative transposase
VGRDQTARLMAKEGIQGATRAKKRFTTKSDKDAPRAPDLCERDFSAEAPNVKWVCDFSYASTWSGIVYVAFVVDVFARRILGWKAARSMSSALVLDALNMAAWVRRDFDLAGLVCHSDAGSQGGFNRPSQHLDAGGGRCAIATSRRTSVSIEGRSRLQAGHRSHGVKTEFGSGWRSLAA